MIDVLVALPIDCPECMEQWDYNRVMWDRHHQDGVTVIGSPDIAGADGEPFSAPRAIGAALRSGSSPTVLIHRADQLPPTREQLAEMERRAGGSWAVAFDGTICITASGSASLLHGAPLEKVHVELRMASCPWSTIVSRELLETCGGLDARFVSLGTASKALRRVLHHIAGPSKAAPNRSDSWIMQLPGKRARDFAAEAPPSDEDVYQADYAAVRDRGSAEELLARLTPRPAKPARRRRTVKPRSDDA